MFTEPEPPSRPPSPEVRARQLQQARDFLQFRAGLPEAEDTETAQRAARILRDESNELGPSVWGLSGDSRDPKAADFSDVSRALDEHAAAIHGRPLAFLRGNGRHVAQ